MKKYFTEQDSLRVINEMITVARGNLTRGSGKYFILWGYIVCLASLIHFLFFMKSLELGANMSGWIWTIASILGIIITTVFIVKDYKKDIVSTYTDGLITNIWLGFGCFAFLSAFLLNGKMGMYIYPAILFIYTFALSVSAKAYKFKWMYISVVICLLCVISYRFIPYPYFSLPMAIAMFCGNIIPGHLLNKIAEKQNV